MCVVQALDIEWKTEFDSFVRGLQQRPIALWQRHKCIAINIVLLNKC